MRSDIGLVCSTFFTRASVNSPRASLVPSADCSSKQCDPDLESGGDYVFDTPPAADAMRQCFAPGTAIRTCQGPIFPDNLITNIMDDMPDSCRTDFTDGQVNRMFMTFHAMREGMPPANADLPPIRDETEVQTVAPNLPRIPPPEVSPF
ncbi:hypothetical protein BC567DRAFT_238883, partial [Phyllosticta citribraziliensis]